MTERLVVSLDTQNADLEAVGGKGKSLSRMAGAGLEVPDGFYLTTAAYRRFIEENDLQETIIDLAKPEIGESTLSFDAASKAIQALILKPELPDAIQSEIRTAYAALGGDGPPVAVRSSANAEDLPDMSFAGQQDTYLNVRGEDAVIAAVRDCWASLWTPRAISYRHEMGIESDVVAMAVVIQLMVASDVSGILFTANPATGERSEMVLNASFGLGEAVVSGQVTPDTYILDRDSQKAKETVIGAKEQKIVSDGDQGTRVEAIAEDDQKQSSLSEERLGELAALALTVEKLFDGVPQDIEWAISDGRLWLLQARPITNLPSDPPKDVTWPEIPGAQMYKRMAAEIMPEPLSPLFEDLYLRGLYDTQTWPEDWEWKGSLTRNHLSNFIIATVNGYAYAVIYVAQGEESRVYWAKVTADREKLPWSRALPFLFKPVHIPRIQADKVDVNSAKAAKRALVLMDLRNGPHRWIPVAYHWSLAFRKSLVITQWEKQSLPAYRAALDRWQTRDPLRMTDQELWQGIRALTHAEARYWHVLRGIIGAAKMTDQALHNFLVQNAPDEGFTSGTFLSGFKSKTLIAEMDMRAIAEMVRANPSIYELMVLTPVARFFDELKAHPEGKPIYGAIDKYLNAYGKQVFNLDFIEPALVEAPLPFITSLKAMVRNSGLDLTARQREVTRKRRANWIQALKFFSRKRVGSGAPSPAGARPLVGGGKVTKSALLEFIRLYLTARVNYPAREEAIFYMGAAWSLLRPFALELGSRLADIGTLAHADDVFYLTSEELEQAIEARENEESLPELKDRAAAQRHLREQRKRMVQPSAIPEENLLAWGGGDKAAFDTVKVNADDADLMKGFAVSPGTVTGIASVIMSPDDFDKMKPDTILVCPLTTPAWTQLFPYATGLVTDIGSITAHGSIVAREYGIPAVLGTSNGTRRIKSGQTITVDGSKGTVTILDRPLATAEFR